MGVGNGRFPPPTLVIITYKLSYKIGDIAQMTTSGFSQYLRA